MANDKKEKEKKATKPPKTPGKTPDEAAETTDTPASPVVKKGRAASGTRASKAAESTISTQQTLDKHLKLCAAPGELHDILRSVAERLSTLASQDFIETKFKELITEEVLNKKIQEVKSDIILEVKKEVKSVKKELKEVTDKVRSQEAIIEELRNKVSDLETATEKLKDQDAIATDHVESLEKALIDREAKIKSLDKRNNDLEQYTRRNSIRVYGVPDNKKETAFGTWQKVQKIFSNKLQLTIRTAEVDIAHRLGKFRSDGNRQIIVKFVQRFTKQDVIRHRRKLKGSGIVVKEDLTLTNAKLLEDVSAHPNVTTAWSDEGRIIALGVNSAKYTVGELSDLDKVSFDPVPQPATITTQL